MDPIEQLQHFLETAGNAQAHFQHTLPDEDINTSRTQLEHPNLGKDKAISSEVKGFDVNDFLLDEPLNEEPGARASNSDCLTDGILQCLECQEILANAQALERHIGAHSKGKQICDICGARYASKSHVTLHKQKQHGIPDLTIVQLSNESTADGQNIASISPVDGLSCEEPCTVSPHWQDETAKSFVCKICGKEYKRAGYLARHLFIVHKTAY